VAGADKGLVTGVSLFDRFAGAGVPDGMVSLGVEWCCNRATRR
jgi:phenylalanyl-tRNA synthetase beta subunit